MNKSVLFQDKEMCDVVINLYFYMYVSLGCSGQQSNALIIVKPD